jgi:hypothetical protein
MLAKNLRAPWGVQDARVIVDVYRDGVAIRQARSCRTSAAIKKNAYVGGASTD